MELSSSTSRILCIAAPPSKKFLLAIIPDPPPIFHLSPAYKSVTGGKVVKTPDYLPDFWWMRRKIYPLLRSAALIL